jgi:hypothetical protein
VLFLIPGLNVTWITDRLAGRTLLSPTERLLRAITWSMLLYALASPWLLRLGHLVVRRGRLWPWEPIIGGAFLIFLAPAVLALVVSWVRMSERQQKLLRPLTRINAAPSAWDFAFAPGGPYFVRLKLKSGERLGGVFGEESVADRYPEKQHVFLEEAWRLDEQGQFVSPIPGSRGILFPEAEIELVEFLGYEPEGIDGEDIA